MREDPMTAEGATRLHEVYLTPEELWNLEMRLMREGFVLKRSERNPWLVFSYWRWVSAQCHDEYGCVYTNKRGSIKMPEPVYLVLREMEADNDA